MFAVIDLGFMEFISGWVDHCLVRGPPDAQSWCQSLRWYSDQPRVVFMDSMFGLQHKCSHMGKGTVQPPT